MNVPRYLLDKGFRANPDYELIEFGRLPLSQKHLLGDLESDGDNYGILRPRDGSGLAIKSVCRETALLYLSLGQPGKLPAYTARSSSDEVNRSIAGLVLDDVLQIESNNSYVSGYDAYPVLYPDRTDPTTSGYLSRLSIDALKYGQQLGIDDATKLSARLYFYNRAPVSVALKERLADADTFADYIGISDSGKNSSLLRKYWRDISLSPPFDIWLYWRNKDYKSGLPKDRPTYKLYVSPKHELIRKVFDCVLDILSEQNTHSFKVGKGAVGLLRPDKIVAYFPDFAGLMDAAERLKPPLAGIASHGVPFTAELSSDGMLSWGIDPPASEQTLSWQERESWRLWVTNRLARALIGAKRATSTAREPWQYALERLRLDDVDTSTWTPNADIWDGG